MKSLHASLTIWLVAVVPLTAFAADDDPAEQIKTADNYRQNGRYAEAIELYRALNDGHEIDADQRVAVTIGLSRSLEETGEWAAATGVLTAALEANAGSAALSARLGELQYLQGRYDAAQESITSALNADPNSALAHVVQGHLNRETGQFEPALREYQWCVRYYNRAQPTDADSLIALAEGSLEYARWKSVSSIFNFVVNALCPDALKDDERCWQAYLISGGLLLEKYNRGQAVPELNQALAINPQAAAVLTALGEAELQDSEVEHAEEFANRALEANPKFPPALRLLADVALATDDTAAALQAVDRALAVDPADQRTLARQAACFLVEDGIPDEETILDLFLGLDAIDELKLESPTRFEQVVIDVARRNPRPGYFLNFIGEFLDQQMKYSAAEQFFLQAVNVMPQLSAPRTNLGMLYMRVGRIEDAERLLDGAFQADPFHVRVSNMRKVLEVLNGYETISTDHFVFRVDAADRMLAGYMGEFLEGIYPELTDRYGYEPPFRTQFEVYGAAKGQGAHQWFSARMVGLPWIQTIGASTGMIVALASPTATEPFNWSRVLRHEFVHILTLQNTGFNIPHWYTEALAVREEGLDMPEEWQVLLLKRVPKGRIFTLEMLNAGFQRPKEPDDWSMAYCQSRLYAQYMEDNFGTDSLERLLDAYRRGLHTRDAVPDAFGVSLDEFEKGYHQLLNEIVARIKPQRLPEGPSLDEAKAAHEADPEDLQAAGRYAIALLESRHGREAGKLAREVLESEPLQPEAISVVARLAWALRDERRAIELLEPAFDENNPHPEILPRLARLKLDNRENEDAARIYRIGTEHWPLEDDFWNGLAVALWRLDDTEHLEPVLKQIVPRDYDNASIRKKLAQIAFADERFEEAADWALQTLYIDVADAEVHQLLAECCLKLDRTEQAERELNNVLELDPDNTDAKALLESLK
jgi:tetratricopeptide (TPR) repeat protein